MKRILVATDFSEASWQATRFGLELTIAIEGDLLLLHVVEGNPLRTSTEAGRSDRVVSALELTGDRARGALPPKLIHRDLGEEAQWKLSALLPAGAPDRFRGVVTVGQVADEIVRVAREQNVDLIVMGTHGRRGLRHLLGSSVAAKVSRQASVPVITVEAKPGDLRRHAGGQSVLHRRSDHGRARVNRDAVGGGANKTAPADVLVTAHTEEAG